MAPPYPDSFPSDHDNLRPYSSSHHLFFPTTPRGSSSSSSSPLSFPLFPALHHSNSDDPHPLGLKHEEDGGIMACNNDQTLENHPEVETGLRFTIWKQIENNHNNNDCVKWSSSSSSSKIRLVINYNPTETATQMTDGGRNFQDLNQMSTLPSPSDQTNKGSMLNDGGGAILRTCSDCNTTKTPLWRSGPRGPKSLCNACGIRQRKARRAMAEANVAIPCGGKPAAVVLKTNKAVQHKIMKPAATLKRKHKEAVATATATSTVGGRGRRKLCFEDMKMGRRLSEISSAYQRVFPQDEREAAILLMTLSYGLLHG